MQSLLSHPPSLSDWHAYLVPSLRQPMCCPLRELWGGSAAGADLPALQHPPHHWWSSKTMRVLGKGGFFIECLMGQVNSQWSAYQFSQKLFCVLPRSISGLR